MGESMAKGLGSTGSSVAADDTAVAVFDPPHRRVWDLPVRVCHWLLVIAFVASYVTNRLGVTYFKYHVWSGYTVIVLVSFRILWGLVGTRHARFRNFVRGPVRTLRYAAAWLRGETQHHAGHNPLGAWMVIALLTALLVQAASGLFANDEIFNTGPLYGFVTDETSVQLTSLHRNLFYWLFAATIVHVLAVIAHRVFKKEDLVAAMFTGKKATHVVPAGEAIHTSRIWLAVLIVLILCGGLSWVVAHAPPAQ
jgi:cytochrome b